MSERLELAQRLLNTVPMVKYGDNNAEIMERAKVEIMMATAESLDKIEASLADINKTGIIVIKA